jgi:hypothetical protein
MPVIFFYLLFLSQIFILSYYYPWKTYARISYVLDHFPPAQYPKLYPDNNYIDPSIPMRKSVKIFKAFNILTVFIGLGALLAAFLNDYKPVGNGEETLVGIFAMVQFIPIIIMEVKSYWQNQRMRELNKSKVRTADLRARRVFDYISPIWVVMAGVLFLGVAVFELYIADFIWLWDKKFISLVGTGAVIHLFFGFLIYKAVYGKKQDPHLSYEDQQKVISVVVHTSVYTSVGMSIFFIVNSAVKEFDLSYLDPVIMSIYFQVLAFIGVGYVFRNVKVEDLDFEVYKKTEEIS